MSVRFSRTLPLLPLLMLLMATALLAEEEETRWYDVEVLLFVQQSQDYRASEQWPMDYTEPDLEGSQELLQLDPAPQGKPPIAFRRLLERELALRADAQRIERAPDLELLAHFGWRQPGLEPDQATPIQLNDALLRNPAMESVSTAGGLSEPTEAVPPRLSGTLKLILSRYLHIATDLLYREPNKEAQTFEMQPIPEAMQSDEIPNAAAEAGEPGPEDGDELDLFEQLAAQQMAPPPPPYHVYRMQQSRRMRSGELHYLDHPVFGLAVKVTPYTPEADAAAAQ